MTVLEVLNTYGADPFRRWLRDTINSGFGHGSQLIDRMTEAGLGADNVARTDRMLEAATAAGWLIKHKWTPTVSQRAFFSLEVGSAANGTPPYTYPNHHGYEVPNGHPDAYAFASPSVAVVAAPKIAPATIAEVKALGGYQVIYPDPPWQYTDKGSNGAAENHYPTMTYAQLRDLPVGEIAAPDAVLCLWATWPLLPQAIGLIQAWGFRYVTCAFLWAKVTEDGLDHFGLGRWTRGNTEPCLLAVKGKPHHLVKHKGVRQLLATHEDPATPGQLWTPEEFLIAPVTRHSAKPPEIRTRIETLFGDVARIELFARERAPGWDVWGNQVDSDVDLSPSNS